MIKIIYKIKEWFILKKKIKYNKKSDPYIYR
jgi:hypothetical protein